MPDASRDLGSSGLTRDTCASRLHYTAISGEIKARHGSGPGERGRAPASRWLGVKAAPSAYHMTDQGVSERILEAQGSRYGVLNSWGANLTARVGTLEATCLELFLRLHSSGFSCPVVRSRSRYCYF